MEQAQALSFQGTPVLLVQHFLCVSSEMKHLQGVVNGRAALCSPFTNSTVHRFVCFKSAF